MPVRAKPIERAADVVYCRRAMTTVGLSVALFAATLVNAAQARDLSTADCNSIGWSLSREAEWLDAAINRSSPDRSYHTQQFRKFSPLWDQCLKLIDEGKVGPDILLGYGSLDR
jgi:hypothetical protein